MEVKRKKKKSKRFRLFGIGKRNPLKQVKKRRKKKSKQFRLSYAVISAITVIVIAFTASVIFKGHLFGNDKYILGFRSYITLSNSMSPLIQNGSLIITRRVKAESIRVGDIISYLNGTEILTHRVAGIVNNGGKITFTTKADAYEGVNSKQVPSDDVIGRFVYSVSHIGNIMIAIRNPVSISLCITGFSVYSIIAEMTNRRSGKRLRKKKRQKWQYPGSHIRTPVNDWRPVQKDLNSMEIVIPHSGD